MNQHLLPYDELKTYVAIYSNVLFNFKSGKWLVQILLVDGWHVTEQTTIEKCYKHLACQIIANVNLHTQLSNQVYD